MERTADGPVLHRGRCLCGAVRYEGRGDPDWVGICHCESCRRATGGALVAWCGFPRERLAFAGELPAYYMSSPGVRRGFCRRCGTSLTYESERWPADVHLIVGNFEHPEALAPQFHVFAAERLPWLHLADGLPRYRTVPSAGDLLESAP